MGANDILRRAGEKDFDQIYSIMVASFPADERRSYIDAKEDLWDSRHFIDVVYGEDDEVIAYISLWNLDSCLFVETFAVSPSHRNDGLGGRMLDELRAQYDKRIALEVELPEDELTRRRIGFYKRHGFSFNEYPYALPPIGFGKKAVPLRIMATDGPLNGAEFKQIKKELYKEVYHMNDILEAMEKRRSVRKYKPDMPPHADIDRILTAGLYAASGMNRQATKIIAVTDKKTRDELSNLNRQIGGWKEGFDPFYGAPVVLIVLTDKTVPTRVYDGSLVIGNLMLAADSLGYGSCWIHRAKEEFETDYGKDLLKKLGIEGEWEGVGHCIIGYADGEVPEASERKEDRVYYVE